MRDTLTLRALAAALLLALAGPALADAHGGKAERSLVIVTSDSLETQTMGMILANTMQEQGTDLHVLLCDAAGELGIDGYSSDEGVTTPEGHPQDEVRPEALLGGLIEGGATVEVCAIFLPNRAHDEGDLRDGVGVAEPGPIAEMMRDPAIPAHSF